VVLVVVVLVLLLVGLLVVVVVGVVVLVAVADPPHAVAMSISAGNRIQCRFGIVVCLPIV
jgi:hypothetical protein